MWKREPIRTEGVCGRSNDIGRSEPGLNFEVQIVIRTESTLKTLAVIFILALCVAVALPVQTTFAAGYDWKGSQDDLLVTVDARWAGCTVGGYYPIRVRLQNRAAARTVTVTFDPNDSGLPTVTRTVALAQNASTSLLVPMVGSTNYGEFRVSDDSGPLRDLTNHFSIADADPSNTRLSLLAISDTTIDCTGFETAVSSSLGASHGRRGAVSTEDHEVIQPVMLPDAWIAYSGLDLVSISKQTLEGLSHETQSALFNWVKANGTLLIDNGGEDPSDAAELDKLIGFNQASRKTVWQAARPQKRIPITIREFDPNGSETAHTPTPGEAEFQWEGTDDAFAIRDLGLGHIVGIKGDSFPGSAHDWGWLLNTLGTVQLKHGDRLGVSGRTENAEFLHFLIPGIQSVPVFSFLIFISVFTFVIGPLNYYMLARRKRLNLLVVTIPTIATVTSLLLFAYSAVAHGFSVKSRVRSLTILDQNSQTAVTMARIGLYAGFTPSGGLEFSPNTSVTPIWPEGQEFETGRVDWTETQALRSGFLRSRTRTQFLTTEVRDERGRLTIEKADLGVNVANGLEWDLAALIVVDDDGNLFFGKSVPAGGSKKLSTMSEADREAAAKLLRRSHPAPPDELASGDNVNMFDGLTSRRHHYGYYNRTTFSVSAGQMEQRINSLRQAMRGAAQLENRSFVAFLKEGAEKSPVEFGTEVTFVDDWHIVVGFY